MTFCFWCRAPVEKSAGPYEPCPECRAKKESGIAVYEVASAADLERPEIVPGCAPTGRYFVLPENRFRFIAALLGLSESHIAPILTHRRMFTEPDLYDKLIPSTDDKADK